MAATSLEKYWRGKIEPSLGLAGSERGRKTGTETRYLGSSKENEGKYISRETVFLCANSRGAHLRSVRQDLCFQSVIGCTYMCIYNYMVLITYLSIVNVTKILIQ